MKKVIKTPKDMPVMLETKPMSREWKGNITDKYWATNYTGSLEKDALVPTCGDEEWREKQYQRFMKSLEIRDLLLTFGGEEACVQPDIDDEDILTRGQFFYGKNAKMMKGQPSRCHSNSCRLWEANEDNPNCHIATGYALTEDGMWRQHSWVVVERPRSYQIYETTVKRIAYFGFIMNRQECEDFCRNNY